jgi:hypothetical protein
MIQNTLRNAGRGGADGGMGTAGLGGSADNFGVDAGEAGGAVAVVVGKAESGGANAGNISLNGCHGPAGSWLSRSLIVTFPTP